jgi:hypothetical protein
MLKPFSEDITTGSEIIDSLQTFRSIGDVIEDKKFLNWLRKKYEVSEQELRTKLKGLSREQVDKLKKEFNSFRLDLTSADLKNIRADIKRWKKSGKKILAVKSVGEDKGDQPSHIKELLAKRGSALTSEEKDEIAATPGIVPPWWEENNGYFKGARKAIEGLKNVSALEVHLAVEKDYTDKPLTEKEKNILRVGWGKKEYGENYHRDVGWY